MLKLPRPDLTALRQHAVEAGGDIWQVGDDSRTNQNDPDATLHYNGPWAIIGPRPERFGRNVILLTANSNFEPRPITSHVAANHPHAVLAHVAYTEALEQALRELYRRADIGDHLITPQDVRMELKARGVDLDEIHAAHDRQKGGSDD